jgi:hypothetical protein
MNGNVIKKVLPHEATGRPHFASLLHLPDEAEAK